MTLEMLSTTGQARRFAMLSNVALRHLAAWHRKGPLELTETRGPGSLPLAQSQSWSRSLSWGLSAVEGTDGWVLPGLAQPWPQVLPTYYFATDASPPNLHSATPQKHTKQQASPLTIRYRAQQQQQQRVANHHRTAALTGCRCSAAQRCPQQWSCATCSLIWRTYSDCGGWHHLRLPSFFLHSVQLASALLKCPHGLRSVRSVVPSRKWPPPALASGLRQ